MKGKNKLYLIITVLVLIMAALFAVLVISNNTNKKIQNGLIKDNLIHYSDVSREEIDEFDDMSKAIFNKVSCTFENVVYNYDDTGKADVTVCYPDMERILPETYNNVINTPSVLDKYSGETEWDRYEEYVSDKIDSAALSKKTISVDLMCEDGIWKIVITPELSDLLSGNIEKAYLQIYNEEE